MSSSQEHLKSDNRLFRALQRLALLGCHVKFQDDWRREHCFTVEFEMQPLYKLPAMKPFHYIDVNGQKVWSEGMHTHTGHPNCTEEQGLNQLCAALENAAETIENHYKTKLLP